MKYMDYQVEGGGGDRQRTISSIETFSPFEHGGHLKIYFRVLIVYQMKPGYQKVIPLFDSNGSEKPQHVARGFTHKFHLFIEFHEGEHFVRREEKCQHIKLTVQEQGTRDEGNEYMKREDITHWVNQKVHTLMR